MIGGFQVGAFQTNFQQTGVQSPLAPHLIWGSDFRKHYHSPLIRKLRRQIPDEIFQVIAEVATPTVAETPVEARLNLAQQEQILRAELKAMNVVWRNAYREALAAIIEQENEDQAILMLLADF